jgi:hypothetical protein
VTQSGNRFKLRESNEGPEAKIQKAIVEYLENRGWTVKVTHGDALLNGIPDLYCVHPEHKQRWIEVKNPENYKFTPAQLRDFPIISQCVGIWILVEASDAEYRKLWQPPNWHKYLTTSSMKSIHRRKDRNFHSNKVLEAFRDNGNKVG